MVVEKEKKTKDNGEYTAKSIQVLEGLEPVRKDRECISEELQLKVCII
jgi:hypothetical protein